MPSPANDPAPDRPPQTKNEWGILVIISLFFGVFLVMELAKDFTPAKWSVPFFLLSWIALLFLHELGHALMARFLGWRVERICIGLGQVRSTSRILGMPIEFRTIPLSGYVLPRPADLIAPRLKQCLIFSAGPGIELLLVGLCVLIFGTEALLQRTNEVPIIAVQSFCVAALFGALLNLIPFPVETKEGTAWSDGLGMILCWKLPDEWFAEQMGK
ncbi:MAG: M50 family metallopeptidase [Verrucomicrobiales bacterium]|nr:M50 family metallopeptidase [Verrucomicrobiales bacterium]